MLLGLPRSIVVARCVVIVFDNDSDSDDAANITNSINAVLHITTTTVGSSCRMPHTIILLSLIYVLDLIVYYFNSVPVADTAF